MNEQRELITGFLAAFVSVAILAGSLALSYAENKVRIAQFPLMEPSQTATRTSTIPTPTSRPGEPTLTASPTPSPTAASPTPFCQFPEGWVAIIVVLGDDLENLAMIYQTSPETLIEANCLLIPSLSPGSLLYVPQLPASLTPSATNTPRPITAQCVAPPYGWIEYTIKSGDTMYSIATIFGTTVSQLQAGNCMGSSTFIMTGKTLWVPNVPTITPYPSHTPTPSETPTLTPSYTPRKTRFIHPTRRPTKTSSVVLTNTATRTALVELTPSNTLCYTPIETPTHTHKSTSNFYT